MSNEKADAGSREETLLKQIDETTVIVKQRETQIETLTGENFNLKQSVENIKAERDKARKQCETMEDQIRNKEMEITQTKQMASTKEQQMGQELDSLRSENQ